MRIAGIQALSLLDFPGHPCAIVFTQGCPFRCAYCHNPELIPVTIPGSLTPKEVFERLEHHQNVVDTVCVTGGEPTVQPDLAAFLLLLKHRGFTVKLDTNGMHPRILKRILVEGLADYVAMDVKQTWNRYGALAHIPESAVKNVRESFKLLCDSAVSHEFRTTVCPGLHTPQDLYAIAEELPYGTTWAWQPVRYGGTLDPNLSEEEPLPLELLRAQLEETRPDLTILIRT